MEQGNLVEWKVKAGEEVTAGDLLADIETDKATLGFETQEDGIIAKLLVEDGAKDIPVGMPLAVVVESADAVSAFADYSAEAAAGGRESGGATSQGQAKGDGAEAPAGAQTGAASWKPRRDRLGPAARMALANAGLDADDVAPSGPNGIVTKGDVLAAVERGAARSGRGRGRTAGAAAEGAPAKASAEPAPREPPKQGAPPRPPAAAEGRAGEAGGRVARREVRYTDTPVSQVRRIIARRLLESKVTIPAIYVSGDARLGGVNALRAALKEAGIKASVNDFVVKAVGAALRAVPGACAGWDAKAEGIVRFAGIDVSVAVATEGGLITPIVKAVDRKTIAEVSAAVRDLAGRARKNKLAPEEYNGGSFTISNLGMYGTKEFCAIINPPQACIMAVGGAQERVVVVDGKLQNEAFMTVTLSADSRVVGEDTAAEFLKSFAFHIENPALVMGAALL